jgi:hypothetical protein
MKQTSKKLTPQEFCSLYLPNNWCEKDLQMYCQRVLKMRRGFGIFPPRDEVVIKTPGTTKGRRSDLETWSTIYEVKCFLDYDKIYHAIAQTELYRHYGRKVAGIFPKQRVVIGVAPPQDELYRSAKNLAKDFSSIRGITVIFINENPEWHMNNARGETVNKALLGIVIFLSLMVGTFLLVILFK